MPKPAFPPGKPQKLPKPSKVEKKPEQFEARIFPAADEARQNALLAEGWSFDQALDIGGDPQFVFVREYEPAEPVDEETDAL